MLKQHILEIFATDAYRISLFILTIEEDLITIFDSSVEGLCFWGVLTGKNATAWNLMPKSQSQKIKTVCSNVHEIKVPAGFAVSLHRSSVPLGDLLPKCPSIKVY